MVGTPLLLTEGARTLPLPLPLTSALTLTQMGTPLLLTEGAESGGLVMRGLEGRFKVRTVN